MIPKDRDLGTSPIWRLLDIVVTVYTYYFLSSFTDEDVFLKYSREIDELLSKNWQNRKKLNLQKINFMPNNIQVHMYVCADQLHVSTHLNASNTKLNSVTHMEFSLEGSKWSVSGYVRLFQVWQCFVYDWNKMLLFNSVSSSNIIVLSCANSVKPWEDFI